MHKKSYFPSIYSHFFVSILALSSLPALSFEQAPEQGTTDDSRTVNAYKQCISTYIAHHQPYHLNSGKPIETQKGYMLNIPAGWKVVAANGNGEYATIILCK